MPRSEKKVLLLQPQNDYEFVHEYTIHYFRP